MTRNMMPCLAAVAMTLLLATPGHAASAGVVTTNIMLPFQAVVQGAAESFAIENGTVHIVTHLQMMGDSPSLEVHTNFVNTTAIGLSTGQTFDVVGGQTVLGDAPEEGGLFGVLLAYMKLLNKEVRGDRQITRAGALIHLVFNEAGVLVGASIDPFPPPCN